MFDEISEVSHSFYICGYIISCAECVSTEMDICEGMSHLHRQTLIPE